MADILEKSTGRRTTDLTVSTTTETIAATSDPVTPPRAGVRAFIRAYVIMTAGTGTTAITAAIRAGTLVTGTLVSEQHAVSATAGDTVLLVVMGEQVLGDVGQAQYNVTVDQTGASADGTVLEAGIEVELLAG